MSYYKPYPAYKDSGVEWIGQVPEHWQVKRLKHLISQCQNGVWGDDPLEDGSDTLCIRVADFDRDNNVVIYNPSTYRQITKEHQDSRLVSKGDILLEKSGGGAQTLVGANVRYLGEEPAVCSNFVAVIKPSKMAESAWLNYLMASMYALKINLRSIKQSTGIQNLDSEQYLDEGVAAPSLDEQATIAATLDRETARIDALIQKKTRFIELLKEKVIATAMTEQMYGDGEHIRLRHLVQIISRPVQLISEDEYIALGLYNRGRGLFHKPPTLGKDIGDSDFFYVEEGDLILSGQFAWEGAVTMASSTESGCVVSHRYPIVRGGAVATEYLFALLMTNFGDFLLNESSRGSAGRNRPLNINLLLNEKIRMPSVKTQEEIKGLIKLKATLEEKVKHSIDLLKERRAAFITAAVTGQIDLRGKQ